ncbi:MBL-fold metallo-hydrolase [Psychrobacillus phage Perkons]|nr:MBL-fold metallo-hydrolase [Psychrobacillus phage Perkons]
MLKFIGSGSAFNNKLGNNSAYYKEGNQMLLIDCGSNIFQSIKENNLLEGIEHIHVLITHTHADHVGSLADLILYTYYSHGEMMKIKTTVYYSEGLEISELLTINDAIKQCNLVVIPSYVVTKIESFNQLFVISSHSKHVDDLVSYSYDIFIDDLAIFYSGDINELKMSDKDFINNLTYDFAYIDTCKADYEGNVHLSLRKLTELIKPEARNRVYCMHLDEGFDRNESEELGFNVVVNELR